MAADKRRTGDAARLGGGRRFGVCCVRMMDDLRQMAASGDVWACLRLAKRLMRGRCESRNYEEALCWFDAAARSGDQDALYWLGKCYLKGLGCPRDAAGGVSCLERAAACGHAGAALRLGECFELGNGAPASEELAAYWYRKSVALGESRAYGRLLRLARRRRG